MTCSDISLLVDYNYWARDRLLEAVAALTPEEFTRPLGNSFSSISPRRARSGQGSNARCVRWSTLGPEGVERMIEYEDFRGAARSEVFWQTLQHLVNHGSYHRGQVTTMLRQVSAATARYMDMIVFYREKRQGS